MPRFVILRHDPSPTSDRVLHWDFMLEAGETLLTWALECEPVYDIPISAGQLADHRLDYLDYEGPVSGGRGRVSRWDAGEFVWQKQTDCEWVIAICGGVLRGQARLTHLPSEHHRWVVSFVAEVSAGGR